MRRARKRVAGKLRLGMSVMLALMVIASPAPVLADDIPPSGGTGADEPDEGSADMDSHNASDASDLAEDGDASPSGNTDDDPDTDDGNDGTGSHAAPASAVPQTDATSRQDREGARTPQERRETAPGEAPIWQRRLFPWLFPDTETDGVTEDTPSPRTTRRTSGTARSSSTSTSKKTSSKATSLRIDRSGTYDIRDRSVSNVVVAGDIDVVLRVKDGTTIVAEKVPAVDISGEARVKISVEGSATLQGTNGIRVASPATIELTGGTLTIRGTSGCGIGGDANTASGNVTIRNMRKLVVRGGSGCAAIGGGSGSGASVLIADATVTARGGTGASGIGTGDLQSMTQDASVACDIRIEGESSVRAYAGSTVSSESQAAAIGFGAHGEGIVPSGTLYVDRRSIIKAFAHQDGALSLLDAPDMTASVIDLTFLEKDDGEAIAKVDGEAVLFSDSEGHAEVVLVPKGFSSVALTRPRGAVFASRMETKDALTYASPYGGYLSVFLASTGVRWYREVAARPVGEIMLSHVTSPAADVSAVRFGFFAPDGTAWIVRQDGIDGNGAWARLVSGLAPGKYAVCKAGMGLGSVFAERTFQTVEVKPRERAEVSFVS